MHYEQIRESEDRSWSLQLVEKLKNCDDENELDKIVCTLQALDDYRTEKPLQEIMENKENSLLLRTLACDVLSGCTTSDDMILRKTWWNSGDEILMRHAIRVATRADKELLSEIAAAPEHKYYIEAIEAMSCRFEEPSFQQLKIRAMSNKDPAIRKAAAETLLWDQPVAAEPGLLILANDEDEGVAEEALTVLCYCNSQTVLHGLSEFRKIGREPLREMQENAFAEVRQTFETSIKHLLVRSPEAFSEFKKWLVPVEGLLDWGLIEKPEQNGSPSSSPVSISIKVSAQEIMERFSNADGKWSDRWKYCRSIDCDSFTESDRSILESFFCSHFDWSVREQGALMLAKLDCGRGLLQLLDDSSFCVRTMAAYWIRNVSKEKKIAEKLWEMIEEDDVGGTNATETLESYVIHDSSSAELNEKLVELALTDQRESIRMTAVSELKKRGARKSIESVLSILQQEPLIAWTVHTCILEACCDLGISVPGTEKLKTIDDLYLQESLAKAISMTK